MIFINSSQKKVEQINKLETPSKILKRRKNIFRKVKFTLNNYNLFFSEHITLLPAQLRQQKGVSKK